MTQDIRTIRIATQGPAGPAGPAGVGDVFAVASQAEMLALAANKGDIATRSDLSKSFMLAATPATTLGNWCELLAPPAPVLSVAGRTGVVTLVPGDISGLGSFATGTDAANLTGTLDNARLSAVPNAALANAGVTISGHALALGGTLALAQADVSSLTTADHPNFAGVTLTGNAAASTPPAALTGAWFSGGSATTTKPQFLIEPTGTTSTGWNASGTGLGVNAPSGFTGSLISLQLNGVEKFSIDTVGRAFNAAALYSGGSISGQGVLLNDGSGNVTFWSGTGRMATASGGGNSALTLNSGFSLGFSATAETRNAPDTRLSRSAAGVMQLGTTANNALGSLLLAALTLSSDLTLGNAYVATPQTCTGTSYKILVAA